MTSFLSDVSIDITILEAQRQRQRALALMVHDDWNRIEQIDRDWLSDLILNGRSWTPLHSSGRVVHQIMLDMGVKPYPRR